MRKNAGGFVVFIVFLVLFAYSESCRRFNPPSGPLPGTPTMTPTSTIVQSPTNTATVTPTLVTCPACTADAYVPDAALRTYFIQATGKYCAGPICTEDLLGITGLDLWGVVDFTGVSLCASLTVLDVRQNAYNALQHAATLHNLTKLALENTPLVSADLNYISTLINLRNLSLNSCATVSDISALSGLINIYHISLDANNISSLVPLAAMTQLLNIYVSWNKLTGLNGISGLTDLKNLAARNNMITDISALSQSHMLEYLDLRYNMITDIGALTINASGGGIGPGTLIKLQGNPLKPSPDADTYVPYLRSMGVTVEYP